jgi:hypothetical protein
MQIATHALLLLCEPIQPGELDVTIRLTLKLGQ